MALATNTPRGTQPDQRRYALYKDQHGRTWGCLIDKRTGHPVDTFQPKFEAPWYPDHQYVTILPDSDMRPNEVVLRYADAIADLERAHERYQHAMLTAGIELHGQAFDETKPTLAVLSRVGRPPKPVLPWRLAEAGNDWLLGHASFDATNPAHVEAAEALGRTDLLPVPVETGRKRTR